MQCLIFLLPSLMFLKTSNFFCFYPNKWYQLPKSFTSSLLSVIFYIHSTSKCPLPHSYISTHGSLLPHHHTCSACSTRHLVLGPDYQIVFLTLVLSIQDIVSIHCSGRCYFPTGKQIESRSHHSPTRNIFNWHPFAIKSKPLNRVCRLSLDRTVHTHSVINT